MAREFFKNLPNTTTPLTAPRLNGLLDGDEAMGNIVVDSIRSKNIFDGNYTNSYIGGNSGTEYIVNNSSTRTAVVKVNPNTEYSITKFTNTGIGSRFAIAEYPTLLTSNTELGDNVIFDNRNVTTYTFTTSSTTNYLYIYVTNDTSNIPYLQVEEGSATDYAPYQGIGYISGSTANGNYIKYDDGTLICYNRITYSESVAVTTTSGALYRSSAIVPFPYYPYTFIEAPAVSFEFLSDNGNHFLWIVKANSATATAPRGIYLFCPTSVTCSDVVLSYIAIGRWK
jgi:hypothetical protein